MPDPPLDSEDWEIAFEVYASNPRDALTLAYHLAKLKDLAQNDPSEVIAAIDRAIDSLFEHTDFRRVGHELFRATIEGKITPEQEKLLSQVGIKI